MPRPRLASVAVELTAHCNQRCAYCYNAFRDDGGASLGAPSADVLIARLAKILDACQLDHVTLTGGEPLMYPGLFAVLGMLAARGVAVQMISNGGMIDDPLAARLAESGVTQLQVTLDGPDAATHDAHTGGAHFERALRGIRALLRHGVGVTGCVVITRKNAAQTGAVLELFRGLGVTRVSLSRFSPAGYAAAHAAALLCSRDDLTTALEQALPFAREHGMELHMTMPAPPCAVEVERFAPIAFGSCAIGTAAQEMALGPDGALRHCTLHEAALGGVADVLDPGVDVAALVQAPEIAAYRARLPPFCEGCLHASTCGGGCGAASAWMLGDARGFPDPLVWQHVDDDFAARLADGRRRLEVLR